MQNKKKLTFVFFLFIYLLLAEVLEVEVVEVHECPRILWPPWKLFESKYYKELDFSSSWEAACPPHIGWLCR